MSSMKNTSTTMSKTARPPVTSTSKPRRYGTEMTEYKMATVSSMSHRPFAVPSGRSTKRRGGWLQSGFSGSR